MVAISVIMAVDPLSLVAAGYTYRNLGQGWGDGLLGLGFMAKQPRTDGRGAIGGHYSCLLYTSDAADDM
jgi:hypothetical protein